MNRKIKFVLSCIIGICILIGISFGFDFYRVKEGKAPLFCLKTVDNTKTGGGIQEFVGVGYKVIRFNELIGWTRDDIRYYKQNKIGTWFMKVEDFNQEIEEEKRKIDKENNQFVPLEEVPQDYDLEEAIFDGCFIQNKQGVYHVEELDEFGSFVGMKQKFIVRMVTFTKEGDMLLQDITYLPEQKIFQIREDHTRDRNCNPGDRRILEKTYSADEYIIRTELNENEQVVFAMYRKEGDKNVTKEQELCKFSVHDTIPYGEYQNFEGTILEVNKKQLTIEPKEGSKIRKIANKVQVKKEPWDYNKYTVGQVIRLTYRRIDKTPEIPKLESVHIRTMDFEIHFREIVNKTDREIYSILTKKEGYEYNVYTYGGDADIVRKGQTINFDTALKTGEVSAEDILVKAQQDVESGIIQQKTAPNGRATLYYYDTSTIVKYNTGKEKDTIYIAKPDLKISELPQ